MRLLKPGKKRKIKSRITHQLSLVTKPLTVLLTPPNNSSTGIEGLGNAGREKVLPRGISDESILCCAGEAAGTGAGGHEAWGSALYTDECL